ncbi:MAG: substrate-binding domain-containing protein [Flavobacteriaceae bacterium]
MARTANDTSQDDDELAQKYLTTKQVASLLHVKERKIYDLAAAGEIPGTRALGKWLFDRQAIYNWLDGHNTDGQGRRQQEAPNVVLGSHDPLLEWALRESNSGLASFLDGSLDGLERFLKSEGICAGLHLLDGDSGEWNIPAARARIDGEPAVLIEWAWRERGLIVAADNPLGIGGVADLAGRRLAQRQAGAGSQVLLEHYLSNGLTKGSKPTLLKPARSENDAALSVLEDHADAAFGLKCVARQFRLGFVPIVRERFDLLVWRRDWFQPPFQRLLAFTRSAEFQTRAKSLTGYDVSNLGAVHFNGR